MNRPTFEEFEQAIYGKDRVTENKRRKLEEIREKINTVSGQERIELQEELKKTELFTGYILPDDTMLCLTNIALGADTSDIKNVTRARLLAAYSKARLYKGRPSDFVPGLFTDGDRQNIDDYATQLGNEEEAKSAKNQRTPR